MTPYSTEQEIRAAWLTAGPYGPSPSDYDYSPPPVFRTQEDGTLVLVAKPTNREMLAELERRAQTSADALGIDLDTWKRQFIPGYASERPVVGPEFWRGIRWAFFLTASVIAGLGAIAWLRFG